MLRPLLFIYFLFIAATAIAQDFASLKLQGDALRKKGKYKKALNLYNQALDRLITYKETVNNEAWAQLSFAIRDAALKIDKAKDSGLLSVKYGIDGDAIKVKIDSLKKQGVKRVLTYYRTGHGMAYTYLKNDPVTNNQVNWTEFLGCKLLIWNENQNVFVQFFNAENIYKEIKINNSHFKDIYLNHFNELINEKINSRQFKIGHSSSVEIVIPVDAESRYVKKINPDDLITPVKKEYISEASILGDIYIKNRTKAYIQDSIQISQNQKTYLGKLIPLIEAEWRKHFPPKTY